MARYINNLYRPWHDGRDVYPCRRRTKFKCSLMSRAAIKERFNIDATGGTACHQLSENLGELPRTRNPPEILDSCLPASSQEFAPVRTDPKRLTEDQVLPSTIRHQ